MSQLPDVQSKLGGTVRERKQGLPVEKLHRVTLNSAVEPLSIHSLCSHTPGSARVKSKKESQLWKARTSLDMTYFKMTIRIC